MGKAQRAHQGNPYLKGEAAAAGHVRAVLAAE